MRITVAAEQRALSPRNTNLTMLAYQEDAMMRAGYKPKTEMNIQTFCSPAGKPKKDYGIKSHHPTRYNSKQEKNEAIAARAKARQFERLGKVVAKHPHFTVEDVIKVLGMTQASAKHAVTYWRKALQVIAPTGEKDKTGKFLWERVK